MKILEENRVIFLSKEEILGLINKGFNLVRDKSEIVTGG